MMTRRIVPPPSTQVRNQSMECFKMVAAIFVVFLHVSFPSSKAQGLMFVLANSAVPLFFAITGLIAQNTNPTASTAAIPPAILPPLFIQ